MGVVQWKKSRRLTVGQETAGLSFEKIVSSVFWRCCADLQGTTALQTSSSCCQAEGKMQTLKEAKLTEGK